MVGKYLSFYSRSSGLKRIICVISFVLSHFFVFYNTTNERHCFNVKSCIPMRIKNERIVFILWYKTLVISAKYMATRNKKMSEAKICSNDIEWVVNHIKRFFATTKFRGSPSLPHFDFTGEMIIKYMMQRYTI